MNVKKDLGGINLECNISRIMKDIENFAQYSKEEMKGCTRPSFSQEDMSAREYIKRELENIGLVVHEDGAGNLRARMEAENNQSGPSVLVGSHIDTVANGGRYDGVLGVVAAIEVLRVLYEEKIKTKYPVELIVFAEEEGANFGITLIGSKSIAGKIDIDYLKNLKNDIGESCYEILKSCRFDIDNLGEYTLKKNEIRAMLELHIEQGSILDQEGCSVGIVESISGIKNYKVILSGVSNHAGATPMENRQDPLVGAAEIIKYLYEAASSDTESSRVVTVGKLLCFPNSTNVIADHVELYVDMRDTTEKGLEKSTKDLDYITTVVRKIYDLEVLVELVGSSDVVHLSRWVVDEIDATARDLKVSHRKMSSGAVHDSVMLTDMTEVGMIFVPSVDGRSHCAEEYTAKEDIEAGCNLFLHSAVRIAETVS